MESNWITLNDEEKSHYFMWIYLNLRMWRDLDQTWTQTPTTPRLYPRYSQRACHHVEQYPMPSSIPLNALNGTATQSGASQPQPPMKQPMSRISSMRRDWNNDSKPSQDPQSKVNLSQDMDPFPWSRSPSPGPKPKARVPVKAPTVSCTLSDKPPPSTVQWQMHGLSGLLLKAWEILGLPSISGMSATVYVAV
jgi:hypothetical protein